MTYEAPSAGEKIKFGPPRRARIPSALYLLASVVFAIVTACAYNAPTGSRLFVWAVEGDRIRPLSVSVIAVILLVSSLATVIRTHMRGRHRDRRLGGGALASGAGHPAGEALGMAAGDARGRSTGIASASRCTTGASSACPRWRTARAWRSS